MRPLRPAILATVVAAVLLLGGDARAFGRKTRVPILAGSWYPQERAALAAATRLLLRVAAPAAPAPTRPYALVVPHAGWNFSGAAAGAAFRLLRPGDFERVVVVGPSHHVAFSGYALDDAAAYRTPLGDVPMCAGSGNLLQGSEARLVPGAAAQEHAIEVLLPFLQTALGRFCLVPVLVGDTGPDEERAFARRLARLDDGRTLFVFSSDFSHYGPRYDWQPFGRLSADVSRRLRAINEEAVARLGAADAAGFRAHWRVTGNSICGRHVLGTLLELLAQLAPRPAALTLAHYASSDLAGLADDSAVSYVAMAFFRETPSGIPPPLVAPPRLREAPSEAASLSAEEGVRLVRLARAALWAHFFGGDELARALAAFPEGAEHEWRRGVFVTLNRTDPREIATLGRLRGCVGQAEPAFPLYYGAVMATLDAALHDSRFPAVGADELRRVAVEVSVLSPPRPISSPGEIEIGRHGVVLRKGERSALYLPQVAVEEGWDAETLLVRLSEKAGLPRDAWKKGASLSVFTAQVFGEH